MGSLSQDSSPCYFKINIMITEFEDSPNWITMRDMNLGDELNQTMRWGIRYNILRVPRGWIYRFINRPFDKQDIEIGTQFVPHK